MENFLNGLRPVLIKFKKLILGVLILAAVVVVAVIIGSNNSSFVSPMFVTKGIVSGQAPGVNSAVMSYRADAVSGGASGASVDESVISPMPPVPSPAPASTPTEPSWRKVIQNGALDLLVKNADDTAKTIGDVANQNEGFVQDANIYEVSDGIKSGSITVRVPSKNFDAVMSAIKKLAVKVNRESTNSEDVTAQYVDLEAQIKNYKAEETQYQEIMAGAVKIQDVLDVAARLADVRGRIERTQGQLNYLSRQVAMSTISVSLTAEPEVQVFGIVWRPLTVIKQAFKSLLTDLTGFVDWLIQFIFKIPIYILRLALAVLIVWLVWKIIVWLKRKLWRGNY